MGIENHKVPVVRISEILPHKNADNLEIIHVMGYQCVVRKGTHVVGDLAVYIPPDSVVPQTEPFRFIWEPYQTEPDGEAPAKRRRITVRKFRKEWSEGLLLPLIDFKNQLTTAVTEGTDVADMLGITHYAPPEPMDDGDNESAPSRRQSKRFPRSLRGWMYFLVRVLTFGYFDLNGSTGGSNETAPETTPPVYDVEAFKHYTGIFQPGERVIVTEKIHGSNARYVFQASFTGGKMYAGSRQLWKSAKSNCVWRKILVANPWIEGWCREHPGYTLYGEAIPTQKGFDYGYSSDAPGVLFFDVRTPDGKWVPYDFVGGIPYPPLHLPRLAWVPILYSGPFNIDGIKNFVDGPSMVFGAKHIREGIVIRPLEERHAVGLGRVQLKIVSNAFLEKDSQ